LRRLITGFLFGTTGACIALSPVGKVSGAHINPAVTLAFRRMGFSAGGLSSLLSADDYGPSCGSGNAAGDRNPGSRPMRLSLLHELEESKTFAT
jgi:hypothetical protein